MLHCLQEKIPNRLVILRLEILWLPVYITGKPWLCIEYHIYGVYVISKTQYAEALVTSETMQNFETTVTASFW